MKDNQVARLDRIEPKHSLCMPPYGFIMIMILLMIILVAVLVILSQTTGFMAMDYYHNGAWR